MSSVRFGSPMLTPRVSSSGEMPRCPEQTADGLWLLGLGLGRCLKELSNTSAAPASAAAAWRDAGDVG